MGTKIRSGNAEWILLGLTAVFLCGVLLHARAEYRKTAAEPVYVETQAQLPPEEIEIRRVNINTAGAAELAALPGIGEVLAERIVRWRESHGAFEDPEDLLQVSGIGEKKLEALRDWIALDEEGAAVP